VSRQFHNRKWADRRDVCALVDFSMRSLHGKHACSVVVAADTSVTDFETHQCEGQYLNGWCSHLCVHTL